MLTHYDIQIFGRVQMVGFRQNTLLKAQQLGINGFVKNLDNGSVYIEAEGEKADLGKFIEWCHHGPRLAKVDSVIINQSSIKNFNSFVIF